MSARLIRQFEGWFLPEIFDSLSMARLRIRRFYRQSERKINSPLSKKGGQGYSSIIFEDGSTLLLSWKGPAIQPPPAGGKLREYKLAVEYAEGTGASRDRWE